MTAARTAHLDEFYRLLGTLAVREHGTRRLVDSTGRDGWPREGIYFFFESGQVRADGGYRVVRVGTHALRPGVKSTLWGRLRQHRGRVGGRNPGGGNHRASIFRGHVGAALIQQDSLPVGLLKSWLGQRLDPAWAAGEEQLERAVSQHIGAMPFLWLAVPSRAGGSSDRGFIERNAIALLSCAAGSPDKPSGRWLGHHATSGNVRLSGLWNSNHVHEVYDPDFLNLLARLTASTPDSA